MFDIFKLYREVLVHFADMQSVAECRGNVEWTFGLLGNVGRSRSTKFCFCSIFVFILFSLGVIIPVIFY